MFGYVRPSVRDLPEEERIPLIEKFRKMYAVSYTHLTLPTNREV